MRFSFQIFATITLLTVGSGCSKNIDNQPVDIDQALIEILEASSQGEGLDHYRLPDQNTLDQIPKDPKNPLSFSKIELGKLLFHETGMAQNTKDKNMINSFSCATCHHSEAGFQSGLRQGIAEGGMGFGVAGEGRIVNPHIQVKDIDVQLIRTPSVLNVAYQKNMSWNGQMGYGGKNIGTDHLWETGTALEINSLGFEGVESQTIHCLDAHRMGMDSLMLNNAEYKDLFDEAFPNIPAIERISMHSIALALAAYQRSLTPNQAPFQRWLNNEYSTMSNQQIRGAMLFFGKAKCNNCHNGPALNSMEFYALGMNDLIGGDILKSNSDDNIHLGRGGFTKKDADLYAFKVPQLYNLKDAMFYGHGATFRSVKQVIEYKNEGEKENLHIADRHLSTEFTPLLLSEEEIEQLTDFVENALYDPNLSRYTPIELPSGNCFPNNDELSRLDLNCK